MPLIQIEQDSPDTIARARQCVAKMVDEVRRYRHDSALWSPSASKVTGYLTALVEHDLISFSMTVQLTQEKDQALSDALKVPSQLPEGGGFQQAVSPPPRS
ncbi:MULTISPECIES: hypothetical protein [unclassified Pseudomonas]|uniref:hypothetical protein n=1 Tax=unclassified Pseudomonas TaxID=196821 RepID=UPI000485CCDE|nr:MULTISPECIES: hypothetical protein [unclassified Pseudomonas]SMF19954.1 hypothetical protein SAMN05660912_02049 [Pseudomonas sp. LAMO17WK12:I1]